MLEMTTQDDVAETSAGKLNENLAKVEELSQRLIQALAARSPANPTLNTPSQELFTKAASSYWTEMLEHPGKLYEQQLEYWGKSVRHFLEAQQTMLRGGAAGDAEQEDAPDPLAGDKRFSNPLWESHPFFRYVKRQYALNAQAIERALDEIDEDLPDKDRRRLDYFAHQIIDMMSPTNFLVTNPDALERALETEGESLVKGLENLIADLEANKGELLVRLADEDAFELGGNIATTPGEVVFRNKMFELIQYAPTTEKVYGNPVVIFQPWIT